MNHQQAFRKRLVSLAIMLSCCIVMVSAMSAGPESAIALLQEQAINSLEAGDSDDAEKALERALRLDSKNPTTWEIFAKLRSNQGLVEQASMMTLKAESLRRDRTSQFDSGHVPEVDLSDFPEVMAIPDGQLVEPGDYIPTLEGHRQHHHNQSESAQNTRPDNSPDSHLTENELRDNSNYSPTRPWVDGPESGQDRPRHTSDNSFASSIRPRSNHSSQLNNIKPGFTESIVELDDGRRIYTYHLSESENVWDTECGYPKCREYNQSNRDRQVQRRGRVYDDNARYD